MLLWKESEKQSKFYADPYIGIVDKGDKCYWWSTTILDDSEVPIRRGVASTFEEAKQQCEVALSRLVLEYCFRKAFEEATCSND
jgi:hypothetical protein